MRLITIDCPTYAVALGKENEFILLRPGEYEGEVWIDPNFEHEKVELRCLDGRMCEFQREALLYRRAFDPEEDEPPFDSDSPVTIALFLEQARLHYGDERFDRLQFMSQL